MRNKRLKKIACYGKWKCYGGRTIHGYEESRVQRVTRPDGRIEIIRHPPEMVSFRIYHEEDGYFEVDDTPGNRATLKSDIKRGKVELEDIDLHNEILEGEAVDKLAEIYRDVQVDTIMVEPPVRINKRKNVSAEKMEAGKRNLAKARAARAEKRKKEKEEQEKLAKLKEEEANNEGEIFEISEEDLPDMESVLEE